MSKVSIILVSIAFLSSCRGNRKMIEESETKQSNKSRNQTLDVNQYKRLEGSAFGDGIDPKMNQGGATGDRGTGDNLTGGQSNFCYVLEHINDTYGFTSLFYKRGDRKLKVFLPITEEMKSWKTSPPSDQAARQIIFGGMTGGRGKRKVVKGAQAKFETSAEEGPGNIPATAQHNGKTLQIHNNGIFGTDDCPVKTIREEGMRSPLILDFDGKGLSVSSVANGVNFNIAGQGEERVAWPTYENETPWLVFDHNLDGQIEGINELFGDQTVIAGKKGFANGFEALAHYDRNKDSVIDQYDAIFNKLQLWTDRNRDGESDATELRPLSHTVHSISLEYIDRIEFDDGQGNMTKQRSSFKTRDGRELVIYDLWVATEHSKT